MNHLLPIDTDRIPGHIIELMYRLKVRDVMTRGLFTGTRTSTLEELQLVMRENNITGVPIAENGHLYGIVSMDDIIMALQESAMTEPAEKRMTRTVVSLEDEMPLSFAISYMEKYHYGRFPVLDRKGLLVGILTSRDIIIHLLIALNKEITELEGKIKRKNPPAVDGELEREYETKSFDFANAGKASTEIKKLLVDRGVPPKTARRVAVASYELEMNQVCHSRGGILRFKLTDTEAVIVAEDVGPGIEDIDAALTEGWSTANEWVRSFGFGAGMGLPNTRRVSDDFSIASSPQGTRIECRITLTDTEAKESRP